VYSDKKKVLQRMQSRRSGLMYSASASAATPMRVCTFLVDTVTAERDPLQCPCAAATLPRQTYGAGSGRLNGTSTHGCAGRWCGKNWLSSAGGELDVCKKRMWRVGLADTKMGYEGWRLREAFYQRPKIGRLTSVHDISNCSMSSTQH
jgi:hypothetical protein